MEQTIVTGDKEFADIDILACSIAYSELLRLSGHNSSPLIMGNLNYSIPDIVKKWDLKFLTIFEPDPHVDTSYVIVDRTDPETFPDFIAPAKIIKIIDHHHDYTDFWKKKLGVNAVISDVGSCAALVWEEFKKKNLQEYISQTSARLLYTAVISNTSNFHSSVTTQSDLNAHTELTRFAKLPKDWAFTYFIACEEHTRNDPKNSIIHDTKVARLPNSDQKVTIGQVELWNSKEFILKNQQLIEETLQDFGNEPWFMTSPSISENKNYLYCKSDGLKKLLIKGIDANFEGDLGQTDRLWLRKEIMEALQTT